MEEKEVKIDSEEVRDEKARLLEIIEEEIETEEIVVVVGDITKIEDEKDPEAGLKKEIEDMMADMMKEEAAIEEAIEMTEVIEIGEGIITMTEVENHKENREIEKIEEIIKEVHGNNRVEAGLLGIWTQEIIMTNGEGVRVLEVT